MRFLAVPIVVAQLLISSVSAQDVKTTETYARIKADIDSVRAINTHCKSDARSCERTRWNSFRSFENGFGVNDMASH